MAANGKILREAERGPHLFDSFVSTSRLLLIRGGFGEALGPPVTIKTP